MVNRMGVALLALIGVLVSAYMAAYTFGMVGSIVCGTGGCETVQNSPWAVFLGVPVPIIGLVGYGALLAAALLGLQPRFEDDRRVALVLIAGAVIGLVFTGYLTYLEAAVIHAWCRWCIVSAVLATLIFVFTLPELRRLRSQP
ncbi:MAG TPA: vitamin K epoxide reductase family protein [Longimicrobiales bacterium]